LPTERSKGIVETAHSTKEINEGYSWR
jgi:hypothetical protein